MLTNYTKKLNNNKRKIWIRREGPIFFFTFFSFFPFNYMWEIFSFSTNFWANSQFFSFLHLYVKFLAPHSKNLRAPQKFFIFAQKRKFDISENLYKNANFILGGTKRKFDFSSILCLNRKFDFICGVARKKFDLYL